ncbi:MAG: bifunctional alpha,alpha-trehalose-phosphate synthase (UDP-forming)/trehalose-phosphatase [Myxococcales bacterium]|jgi:trehalose 6-phosphate synthase/phosphatase
MPSKTGQTAVDLVSAQDTVQALATRPQLQIERPTTFLFPVATQPAAQRRVLLVSNRLPVTVKVEKQKVTVARSSGGLATGLSGPHQRSGGLWLGWPGETSRLDPAQREQLDAELSALNTVPLYLSASEVNRYYESFSNGVLWPLFHYLVDRIPLLARDWKPYEEVNQRFADLVVEHFRPGDLIWVHDYQLCLVPGMLRQKLPEARIGFFLHIPFPANEVFRILPWREQLLQGLLGADLIGFHTLSYVRHFTNALLYTLGLAPAPDHVWHQGRKVRIGAFPMGIDANSFAVLADTDEVQRDVERIRQEAYGHQIMLGIDRLDYTKGIPRRLLAIERLLEREPALRGKLRFIQVAVPSRTKITEYKAYRESVDLLVGRINGAYGTPYSMPIHYLFRSFSQKQITAMYRAADVMLVTPLRDGMNLVAKEFVASRTDEDGVLVLSELAGAASELGEALLVNPYDIAGTAEAIAKALAMPAEERRTRMRALRRRVFQYDVHTWAQSFVDELSREVDKPAEQSLYSKADLDELVGHLRAAARLLLLLDYDGTLVPFVGRPELAAPDPALRSLLLALARRPDTDVHVVSGRTQDVLERWLGDLPIGLHAEHGLWSRRGPDDAWRLAHEVPTDWKQLVRGVFEQFVIRVPGSFVEEKTASIAWHYRMADSEFGARQAKELHIHLTHTLANYPIEVLPGNRVIEVRPHGIHKGLIVERLKQEAPQATFVAVGDDRTDEDLFAALPDSGTAIHVGPGPSRATVRIADVAAARALLRALTES